MQNKNGRRENKIEPNISNFSRNTGPKALEEKKSTSSIHPSCGSTCLELLCQGRAPISVFKSSLLYKHGAECCSHTFLRMSGAEFCLQYTLASQLLIKTCCLRCATALAIHLFPSLSSYSSHIAPRYRITDRFILNVNELHTVGKNCVFT